MKIISTQLVVSHHLPQNADEDFSKKFPSPEYWLLVRNWSMWPLGWPLICKQVRACFGIGNRINCCDHYWMEKQWYWLFTGKSSAIETSPFASIYLITGFLVNGGCLIETHLMTRDGWLTLRLTVTFLDKSGSSPSSNWCSNLMRAVLASNNSSVRRWTFVGSALDNRLSWNLKCNYRYGYKIIC